LAEHHTAGATLHELASTAQGLQPRLQAVMRLPGETTSAWTSIDSIQKKQQAPLLHGLQHNMMCNQTLPSAGAPSQRHAQVVWPGHCTFNFQVLYIENITSTTVVVTMTAKCPFSSAPVV